jgi:hypothetical protein
LGHKLIATGFDSTIDAAGRGTTGRVINADPR